MLIRRILGMTGIMGPPNSWGDDDPSCVRLPVRLEQIGGHTVYASAWEPTPDELEALNAGASVILRCLGSQPPVSVVVESNVLDA